MIVFLIGTRPDIIKCSPLIKRVPNGYVLHTGQHYSEELDGQICRDMDVHFNHRLDVPIDRGVGGSYASIYKGVRDYLKILKGKEEAADYMRKPGVVVVYGDTLSALAGACAAKAEGWLVAHVEAGLRSFDLTMPEEVSRLGIDAISDRLYAPTTKQEKFLLEEGHATYKVRCYGNLVADSLKVTQEMPLDQEWIRKAYLPVLERYAVMTLHRQENVKSSALEQIIDAVQLIAISQEIKKVYFPVHPGARGTVEECLGGSDDRGIIELLSAVSYRRMVAMVEGSYCVFTDSGGLQEETALMGVKCVTFRKSTERQETIDAGYNVLVSPLTHNFIEMVSAAIEHLRTARLSPSDLYGKNPSEQIAADLKQWRNW